MKLHDDTPWWVWSIIWLAFAAALLAGGFVVESKMEFRDYSAVLRCLGLSAIAVGITVPWMRLFNEEIEPRLQVILWIGICVVIPLILYLRGIKM